MASGFIKFLKNLFVPNGLLFLIIVCIPAFSSLPQNLWPYSRFYPYFLYMTAAALCWRFHKDRYFFSIICIGISERLLFYLISEGGVLGEASGLLHTGFAILLPLNLIIFELIKDRGVFSPRGIIRWLLIAGESAFLGFIYFNPGGSLTAFIQAHLMELTLYSRATSLDPVAAVFLLSLLVLVIRFLYRQVQYESSTIWVLILLYLGLHHTRDMALMTYFTSSTALVFIAAILENSYRLAYYDELTGLPARRALNDQLLRLGSKYVIAMADIDHFKKFNDRYGHDVGDQVLKMVATKLKGVAGRGKPFRYGGEEFAIIFPGGTLDQAVSCLESLRNEIGTTKFTIRGLGRTLQRKNKPGKSKKPRKSVKITISIGGAEKSEGLPDARAVIKAADKALYRAKKSGRNKVST